MTGRPSKFPDRLNCHFPADTLARMAAVLRGGETPVAFAREAMEAELVMREELRNAALKSVVKRIVKRVGYSS